MIIKSDSLEWLKKQDDATIDHIITDPPYLIDFMGKGWDAEDNVAGSVDYWKEALRVCKAGSYALVFGHSRTHHRVMAAMEDAGWEIRDCIMWLYGQGFPKSHNIALGIDKKFGGKNRGRAIPTASSFQACDKEQKNKLTANKVEEYVATTDVAKDWQGWGSGLKPAYEPIIMARKPFKGSLVDNVLKNGLGAINIDDCRITYEEGFVPPKNANVDNPSAWTDEDHNGKKPYILNSKLKQRQVFTPEGRFPANVILSHNPECKLVGTKEETTSNHNAPKGTFAGGEEDRGSEKVYREQKNTIEVYECVDDCPAKLLDDQMKEASRFFYCAKVSKKERNAGCESLEDKEWKHHKVGGSVAEDGIHNKNGTGTVRGFSKNNHPTVKPIKLMEYLIKLVSKEGQTILDPFAGSGSTGIACKNLNREFILVEREDDYINIIKGRLGITE